MARRQFHGKGTTPAQTIVCATKEEFPLFAETMFSVSVRLYGWYLTDQDTDLSYGREYILTPVFGDSVPTGWDSLSDLENEADCLCDILEFNNCEDSTDCQLWLSAYDEAQERFALHYHYC